MPSADESVTIKQKHSYSLQLYQIMVLPKKKISNCAYLSLFEDMGETVAVAGSDKTKMQLPKRNRSIRGNQPDLFSGIIQQSCPPLTLPKMEIH